MVVYGASNESRRNYDIFAFEVISMRFTTIISFGLNMPTKVGRRTVELDNSDPISVGLCFCMSPFFTTCITSAKYNMACRESNVDNRIRNRIPVTVRHCYL